MRTKLILFAFITMFAFACKKDKVAPTLTIASPADGAQASGIVLIKGTVADEKLLSIKFKIIKDATGTVLYSKELSIDGLTAYNYEEQFDPGIVVAATNVTLTVEASDKNSSKTTKTVKFTLVP